MRLKESVKEYLSFSRNERLGAVLLLALCVALIILWIWRDANIPIHRGDIEINYIEKEDPDSSQSTANTAVELFNFDPNGLPAEDWKKLGLSDRQIKGIHNYEKAGGVFRTKEDVEKMYTISDEKYAELEPYIRISSDLSFNKAKGLDRKMDTDEDGEWEEARSDHASPLGPERGTEGPTTFQVIELNSATAEQLVSLKGIGPVFSKNILKYKDLLGGYCSIDQLNEVYGLREHPETVESISEFLTIDTSQVVKINVNTDDPKDLADHIYIDWNVAKAMVNYRKAHGPYSSVQSVTKCKLVDDSLLTKIAPYLKVD